MIANDNECQQMTVVQRMKRTQDTSKTKTNVLNFHNWLLPGMDGCNIAILCIRFLRHSIYLTTLIN